jgi:hypothetical protein
MALPQWNWFRIFRYLASEWEAFSGELWVRLRLFALLNSCRKTRMTKQLRFDERWWGNEIPAGSKTIFALFSTLSLLCRKEASDFFVFHRMKLNASMVLPYCHSSNSHWKFIVLIRSSADAALRWLTGRLIAARWQKGFSAKHKNAPFDGREEGGGARRRLVGKQSSVECSSSLLFDGAGCNLFVISIRDREVSCCCTLLLHAKAWCLVTS